MNLTTATILLTKRATLSAGQFAGYASTFSDAPDRHGDRVLPGAFTTTIAAWQARGAMPPLLFDHQSDVVIGVLVSMREDAEGLAVRGQLLDGNEAAETVRELMELGALGLSIGAIAPPGTILLGDDGTRVFTKLDLFEVSMTAVPADPAAIITAHKSVAPSSPRELQDALRRTGLSKRQAEKVIKGGWPALRNEAADPEPELSERQAADIAARLSSINQMLRG